VAFDLEKLFLDVFAPARGETVTVLHDLPHGAVADTPAWADRRALAAEWRDAIADFASRHGLRVNPLVTYPATGTNNGDLPLEAVCDGAPRSLPEIIAGSTIVLALTQFSASSPLYWLSRKHVRLRAASLPGVARSMQATGLAADYREVAQRCTRLVPLFDTAVTIEATFSTGHVCRFDVSDGKPPLADSGQLPATLGPDDIRVGNLPAGEVFVCPVERSDSATRGELPVDEDGELVVLDVAANRIASVAGDGPAAARWREELAGEPARANIAEVAVGCNPQAAVTGIVLEDEKAGFHWAFGRSDSHGGTVGPGAFTAPDRVVHQDIVYARQSPIVCARLDFVAATGDRTTAIRDGELLV